MTKNISERIEKQEKQQEKEKKEILASIKLELKNILLCRLIELYNDNINIYIDEVKDQSINEVIQEYINNTSSQAWSNRLQCNYKSKLEIFLNQNYYTIASHAERIAKKQQPAPAQQPKEAEHTKKQATFKYNTLIKIIIYSIIVIFVICFAPVAIVGFFLIGFIVALCGGGKKKKFYKKRRF